MECLHLKKVILVTTVFISTAAFLVSTTDKGHWDTVTDSEIGKSSVLGLAAIAKTPLLSGGGFRRRVQRYCHSRGSGTQRVCVVKL